VTTVPRALSVANAAKHLDCGRTHVYDLIAAGELRSFDAGIGRVMTRIPVAELEKYMERRLRSAPARTA
jgi:excisionase family DNA binding protein